MPDVQRYEYYKAMTDTDIRVKVNSETGRLNAVLMHRPGPEVEAMTPTNAHTALYSDILSLDIAGHEYDYFAGALSKVTRVFYVKEVLAELLTDAALAQYLVKESCAADGCLYLVDELLQHAPAQLAEELIEGFRYREGKDPKEYARDRYVLKPLYNLFFTRDASSCVFDRALINSMSFPVRNRESLLYEAIFRHYFKCDTFQAKQMDAQARTEGGDVQIVRPGLLCVGNGIRTNKQGIDQLMKAHAHVPNFTIIAQELPYEPDSFIHLDMVFTFLGQHSVMAYEPLLRKTGGFASMATTIITNDNGTLRYKEMPNIVEALATQGVDVKPVLCGNGDDWMADREQWHSGANFFSFGDEHVIGYRRNRGTITALDQAGYSILNAEDVAAGKVDPFDYQKAVVTFAASELPRGGGGARCMTCPINRD